MRLLLVGNQNSGKTTLFNGITLSHGHTGNFAGVTVCSMAGKARFGEAEIVDLPGIYSLRSFSDEERVALDSLSYGADGIINVVDSTNPERNLYLTIQLLTLGKPMVVALTFTDESLANGDVLNSEELEKFFGIPFVKVCAPRSEGLKELTQAAERCVKEAKLPKAIPYFSGALNRTISGLGRLIQGEGLGQKQYVAEKLIEGEAAFVTKFLTTRTGQAECNRLLRQLQADGYEPNAFLADQRYLLAQRACAKALKRGTARKKRITLAIDRVLCRKSLALPIFACIMGLVFLLCFRVFGKLFSDLLASGIGALATHVSEILTQNGTDFVVVGLVRQGLFGGVGSVLTFLPYIVVLFFFLSVIEDSGYMARIAYIADKPLRRLGLSGSAVVPILLGFGCSVTAILSAAVLSKRDRRLSVLLTPFVSCSAKTGVYSFFAVMFFPKFRFLVISGLYILGLAVGLTALAIAAKGTKDTPQEFLMELPLYRLPTLKNTLALIWEKIKDFLGRAFSVVLFSSVLVWFLDSFNIYLEYTTNPEEAILGRLGSWLSPLFAPLGLSDSGQIAALLAGISAKEAIPGTLFVLSKGSPLAMFNNAELASFLVFVLFYCPCAATLSCVKKEMGTGAALRMACFQTALAWVLSGCTYQLAALFTGIQTSLACKLAVLFVGIGLVLVFAVAAFTVGQWKGDKNGCIGNYCKGCKHGRHL